MSDSSKVKMPGTDDAITAAARSAQELLSRIVSIAADAIISIDEEQRITMFNHGAEAIFGYSAEEMLGQPLDLLLPEKYRAAHGGHINAFGRGPIEARRMGERREIFGRRKNGEIFPADASISRVRTDTGWIYTAVLRDVTDAHRAAEEKTRLLAEAQRALAMRDEVLGVVSHDLRNPLSAISLCCAALIDQPEAAPEDTAELGRAIRESADLMQRLIADLLNVASIEAGKLSLEVRPTDPIILAVKAGGFFERLAADRGVTLAFELPDRLPTIAVDVDRMLQVLGNLLSNALKFTPRGGTVVLTGTSNGANVIYSVRDTGPGIPEDELPRIFERFWQLRRGARVRGTGLGLTIARGIVSAHGGHVWAESSPGAGSTFFVSLPIAERALP